MAAFGRGSVSKLGAIIKSVDVPILMNHFQRKTYCIHLGV